MKLRPDTVSKLHIAAPSAVISQARHLRSDRGFHCFPLDDNIATNKASAAAGFSLFKATETLIQCMLALDFVQVDSETLSQTWESS